MRISKEIEYLIIWKNLNGLANADEQAEFEEWLKQSSKNRDYFNKLKSTYNNGSLEITPQDIEKSWKKINQAINTDRSIVLKRWLQYAAAIILPLGIAITVLWMSNNEVVDPLSDHELAIHVKPGASKAILKLGNGDFVTLDGESTQLIQNQNGEVIGNDSSDVLSYSKKQLVAKIEYNTISIPRGGEYQLVLSDGTRVWLNSETVLSYPVAFEGDKREVQLTGEAYFDVSTDKNRPFIVNTASSAVKVYGTQFNVMAYEDDQIMETTLVEGSIAMLFDGQETLIKPGQQAQVKASTKQLFVNEVNVDLYTAWKDGIFRFEEMALQQMADKLARWYDVDFYFTNEDVKNKRFTGAVRRETNFEFFINLIEETTKVKIDIDDKTVLVKALY